MITDPPTAAKGRVGGAVYGVAVALTAATLMAAQGTEFATKVALLGALTLVCLFRPLIERLAPQPYEDDDRLRTTAARFARRLSPAHPKPAGAAFAGVAIVAAAALLVGAGVGQRSTAPGLNVERPDVSALVAELPEVSLDPAVADLVPGFDQAQAEVVVADLAADLTIEAAALDAGDHAVLSSALVGPRLEAATAAIDPALAASAPPTPGAASSPGELPDGGEPAGVAPAPGQRATLDSAKVTIVRTNDSAQALPSLGVIASGALDDPEADGSSFTSVFVMANPADSWLLVDVLDPDALPGG